MGRVRSVGIYAIMHFLVDFICAAAMFYRFIPLADAPIYILLYNFCAFALQMPLGVVMDRIHERSRTAPHSEGADKSCAPALVPTAHRCLSLSEGADKSRGKCRAAVFAGVGCVLTVSGGILAVMVDGVVTDGNAAVLKGLAAGIVAILGLGNAMFHVGGGVGTMYLSGPKTVKDGTMYISGTKAVKEENMYPLDVAEDEQKRECVSKTVDNRLAALGIFVAPGAVGLFLGGLAGKGAGIFILLVMAMAVALLIILAVAAVMREQRHPVYTETVSERKHPMNTAILCASCCFLVVVLRSFAGLAIAFPWKTTIASGLLAVAAVAGGKAVGGFAASRLGIRRTVIVSLILAALFYGLSGHILPGVIALFFFNMTMPVTLYMLAEKMPGRPGLAFGILTFGLFIGFLPVYCGWTLNVGFAMTGAGISAISLVLLILCLRKEL